MARHLNPQQADECGKRYMSGRQICYLDNNATTRVAPEVVEAMLPFLTEHWGNPSSAYRFGREVARRVEEARVQVAALVHAEPREIIFTSGGTEGNNSAIQSALDTHPARRHVVTTAVEHSATLKFCRQLQQRGYDVTFLAVEADGTLDLHLLEQSIRPDTAVVSVMWANNETGVLFPVEEIAALCRSKGVPCHTDAVQVAGKLDIDVNAAGVDFLSLSAHKFHAPKGVGLLYVRSHTRYHPYIIGGQQERGRRGGTENVASIVGMGRAAALALGHLDDANKRVRALRDRLEQVILREIPGASRNGAREPRVPNTANLSFESVEAEGILQALDRVGICASSGSACTAGSVEPSHVLLAMGLSPARARSCVRFSLGVYNTDSDVEYLLDQLPGIVARLRGAPPPAPTRRRSSHP
jgi:cysteine desulfurase